MPPWVAKKGAKTKDSTAMSLMRIFSEGPEVSLRGSPMVSPITAALCGSEPFGPRVLACSDAPACKPWREQKLMVLVNMSCKNPVDDFWYCFQHFYLNVFLGVVPSTSSVGCRDGNLNGNNIVMNEK